jgi:hypothetical protein
MMCTGSVAAEIRLLNLHPFMNSSIKSSLWWRQCRSKCRSTTLKSLICRVLTLLLQRLSTEKLTHPQQRKTWNVPSSWILAPAWQFVWATPQLLCHSVRCENFSLPLQFKWDLRSGMLPALVGSYCHSTLRHNLEEGRTRCKKVSTKKALIYSVNSNITHSLYTRQRLRVL